MRINKKDFLSIMQRILDYNARERKLSEALSEYCEDVWFFIPKDVLQIILDLLIQLTGDNPKDSIIEYWMFELDYGKKWEPYTITDISGADVKLQTPEDLYKYLVVYNENK